MQYCIPTHIHEKLQSAILITGSARSGTTLMGKIISSINEVEFSFEPPTLFSLIPLIEQMDKNQWKLIFSTYLYHEFFCNAIAGRNLNFNKNDDSYIFKVKERRTIEERLEVGFRKDQIDKLSDQGIIGFKMPDIVPYLSGICDLFPKIRVIQMTRNPISTISSLLKKGWFSDYSLNETNRIYPLVKFEKNLIPYWVKVEDYDRWVIWDEVNRCAYYYLTMAEPNSQLPNIINVQYEDLVNGKDVELKKVLNFLNLEKGSKTDNILSEVVHLDRIPEFNLSDLDVALAQNIRMFI